MRAIAIATGRSYREIYAELAAVAAAETSRGTRRRNHPRTWLRQSTVRRFLEAHGWTFVTTTTPGGRPRLRLRAVELPAGRILVALSRHLCAVVDGVLHDTYDCSRAGTRRVYGYFTPQAGVCWHGRGKVMLGFPPR
ncbi:MAG: hypothetical protein JOZ03_06720 [Gammaproteobacteria bacterium]|nr:hypothetical protein [Gammaproteobacteria bacterium]